MSQYLQPSITYIPPPPIGGGEKRGAPGKKKKTEGRGRVGSDCNGTKKDPGSTGSFLFLDLHSGYGWYSLSKYS